MFSKALFKQSMKANWIKWTCVTVATCVMLAIVIIALGSLAIDNIRDSLKTVFLQADQESVLKESAVDSYELYNTTGKFENGLATLNRNVLTFNLLEVVWNGIPGMFETSIKSSYDKALTDFQTENPDAELNEENLEIVKLNAQKEVVTGIKELMKTFQGMVPISFTDEELNQLVYIMLCAYENDKTVTGAEKIAEEVEKAYTQYVYDNAYELALAQEDATEESALAAADSAQKVVEAAIGKYSESYNEEEFKALANDYVVNDLIYNQVLESFNLGENSTKEEKTEAEYYAVSSMVIANTAISTYEFWIDEYNNEEKYPDLEWTLAEIKTEAKKEASKSLSDQLDDIDEEVAIALKELGEMDIYGLIIGNLFYRVAGILLPMVYVIMVANGLLAGQVDSGSMAYVLSTPTKRRTVTVTQMVYLMLSLLAMFLIVTVVSVISIWIVGGNEFTINFAEILILNLGAYLTMFAFSGFCFMCSSIFNRTKYSLSIGGGISIFMLVCTILGLFGSDVVPMAMRIDQMNFFNYLSIITLFDATSILTGGISWLWKFGILALIGIVTFIVGVFCFEKKDLPL